MHVATQKYKAIEFDTQQFGHRYVWKPWNQNCYRYLDAMVTIITATFDACMHSCATTISHALYGLNEFALLTHGGMAQPGRSAHMHRPTVFFAGITKAQIKYKF